MSPGSEQPEDSGAFRVRHVVTGAAVSMAVTTAVLHLPPGKWTVIPAVGLVAFLWLFTREFGLWCQSMGGTALGSSP